MHEATGKALGTIVKENGLVRAERRKLPNDIENVSLTADSCPKCFRAWWSRVESSENREAVRDFIKIALESLLDVCFMDRSASSSEERQQVSVGLQQGTSISPVI